MFKLLLARQRVSASELVAIAHGPCEVVLDTAGMDKLATAWAECKDDKSSVARASLSAVAAGTPCLSAPESRAVMGARLVSLMHGRSMVRPDALRWLSDVLNAHISPCLPAANSDLDLLTGLAAAMAGQGEAWVDGSVKPMPLIAALTARGLHPIELSAFELSNFTHSFSASAAMAALALHALSAMVDTADTGTY